MTEQQRPVPFPKFFFSGRFHSILYCLCLLLLIGSSTVVHAQTDSLAKKKSAGAKVKRPGFDLPDSLFVAVDTLKHDIDTIIYYTAKDSTVFEVGKKRVTLTGNATLDYQQRNMQAHRIILDFPTNLLTAMSSAYDSVIENTVTHQRRIIRDTTRVKSRGAPKLMDGATPYEGEILSFNLQTKQGTVDLGSTTMEGGFYYGEKIKQVDQGVLFVKNGRYTTCTAPTPHYYFESPRMKVVSGDQVFAEPVYLYIADVPIFVLPFAVFPQHETGRHSGLIVPNYTVQNSRGFGLTHLGYYEVFSDYLDAAFRSDIYTKGGFNLDLTTTFMKRYLLTSPVTLDLGYGEARYNSSDDFNKNFRLYLNIPNLQLDPVTSVNSNITFQSTTYQRDNAQNINDLVNQNVTSNASFSTQFEKLGLSFGASYSRTQNLQDNTYTESSPRITISRTSPLYIFGNNTGESSSYGILQSFSFNYSFTAARNYSKSIVRIPRDSVHGIIGDTSYQFHEQLGILHSPSISLSPKVGYISVVPSFDYGEAWFIKSKTKTARYSLNQFAGHTDSTIVFDNTYSYGFDRLYRYDVGVAVSTTAYGILNVGALGVKAIRHTVLPSISLRYQPDLSYQEKRYYTDPRTGQQIAYSRFEDDLNSGFTMGGKSAVLGYSLGNDFEAKIERQITSDSTSEEKIKLLNLSLNSGYDLEQKLFSALSLSANTQIGTFFNFGASATYSFYPQNYLGGDSIQHTLISLGQGIVRATNASFHVGGAFSSSETSSGENVDSLRALFKLNTPDEERQMFLGGNYPGAFVYVPFRPKWNLNYDFSYTLGYSGAVVQKNFSAGLGFTFSPTERWSFTSSAQYDLASKQFLVPNLRVHRDLSDCWEMNFDYRPTGIIRGFNFEIRLKSPQLQDIKLTRQESTYGTF